MDRGGAVSARESGQSCRMWGLASIAGRASKMKGADRLFAHAAAASAVSTVGATTPRPHLGTARVNARPRPDPCREHLEGVGAEHLARRAVGVRRGEVGAPGPGDEVVEAS